MAALKAGDQAGISAAVQTAISKVSDGSNLTLDPDLDSYYLMDAISVRLPELRSALLALSAAEGMLEGSAKVNGAAIVAVVAASTRLSMARSSAASSIDAAMDGNPDGSVRKKLADTVAALAKSGAASTSAAATLITSLQGGQGAGAKELKTALAAEIAAVEALWLPAQAELVRLLNARIAEFESQRFIRMVIVSLCLFLTGVVLVLVVRSIRRPLANVLTAIGRFQSGDFITPVAGGELNNEFGEIARALKRLQGMTGEHALTTAGLNGSGAMLMITDPNERINFMSSGLVAFLMKVEPFLRSGREDFSIKGMYGEHIDYYNQNNNLRRELISDNGKRRRVRYEISDQVVDVDMSAVYDANGGILGHALVWTDITQELAAEREISAIVNGAAQGDFTRRVDIEGKKSTAREIAQGLNAVSELVVNAASDFGASLAALAAGDLTRNVAGNYVGIFGELKKSIDETIDRLADTITVIQQTSADVSTAASEIRAGSENLRRPYGGAGRQPGRKRRDDRAACSVREGERRVCERGCEPRVRGQAGRRRRRSYRRRGRRSHRSYRGLVEADRRYHLGNRGDRIPDQPACTQCGRRGCPCRRRGQRLCRGRIRGAHSRPTLQRSGKRHLRPDRRVRRRGRLWREAWQ